MRGPRYADGLCKRHMNSGNHFQELLLHYHVKAGVTLYRIVSDQFEHEHCFHSASTLHEGLCVGKLSNDKQLTTIVCARLCEKKLRKK